MLIVKCSPPDFGHFGGFREFSAAGRAAAKFAKNEGGNKAIKG